MKYSIVLKSTVTKNFDFRIDADYYNPEYLRLAKQIHKKQYVFLEEKSCVKGGKRLPLGENFSNEGVPYIRAEDVKNSFVEYENSPKISLLLHNKLKNYKTAYNDVLITIVGNSIGDIGIVKFKISKCNLTENCAKIVNLREILPEYLFIFLCSKFGQYQIKRETVGTAQPKLALVRIKQFQIPILLDKFQNKISDIVETSYIYTCNLNKKYKLSEKILIKELNIENWTAKHKLWSVKNYSDVKDANRLDAEYFQPKYDEIIKLIKNYSNGYDKLKNIVKIKDVNFIPEPREEYKYIELANIAKNGEINNCTVDFGENLPTRARRIVSTGDVVVSSIEGSLNSIALITNDNNNSLCSTGFYVINSNFINPETLFCLMKSEFIQMQLKRGCSGTILTAINKDEFENILLPKINSNIQVQIKENIQEMYKLKCQSKQLLEIAKRGVEIAIEQDEDIATNWINQELQKIGVEL